MVCGEDIAVALADALEQSRRPLDVGEEQGYGARRQLAHARSISVVRFSWVTTDP
jgi:hypothetical protein